MATTRRSCTTRTARSRCQAGNPPSKEGARSHETGATRLCALCLCPAHYLGGDRRASSRSSVLPCSACILRKGELSMQQTDDETRSTNNEQQIPSTGQVAKKARLEAVIPTALVGPAQQGREPYPIILPHITIGVSVAPNVPALPAALAVAAVPPAVEHRATLVLTPITNEGKREETGAHEQRPAAAEGAVQEPIASPPPPVPEQKSGYPVIMTPIPTPGDLSHTTQFPSAPVQHQAQQWSRRHQRL